MGILYLILIAVIVASLRALDKRLHPVCYVDTHRSKEPSYGLLWGFMALCLLGGFLFWPLWVLFLVLLAGVSAA